MPFSFRSLGAWLIVCLSIHTAVANAAAPVTKQERDAVVIVELDKHAIEKYRWFYRRIEDFSVSLSRKLLGPAYRSVTILYREKASLAELRRTLSELAARKETRAIDLFLQVHGNPGSIAFWEGNQDMKKIAFTLNADSNLAGKLRALHSSACFGVSHSEGWLAAGFDVVNGAREVNANGMFDFPEFLKLWTAGNPFADAQLSGNNPKPLKQWDDFARSLGFSPVDSHKEVFGRQALTIDSM